MTSSSHNNTSVRLAYLLSQYPATNHTFLLWEVRTLRRLGFEVHVASVRAPDRPVSQLTPVELEEFKAAWYVKPAGLFGAVSAILRTLFAHPVGWFRGVAYAVELSGVDLQALGRNLFYLAEAMMVGDWMRRRGLAHVHTHFSSTVVLLLGRVFPVTISMTLHGSAEFYDPEGFYLRQKIAASRFVIAISNHGRSQMLMSSPPQQWQKIEVCPLGVDPDVFRPRQFRPNPPTFTITCVGRLAPAKGQPLLVNAVAQLIEGGRAVRLRLVGDGPVQHDLEQQIQRMRLENHVVLEGALNQDRVRAVYAETDIFALASFAEGVPVVLMEAMAMQIPCVATWITGVPELIRDGVDGLLIPPAHPAALTAALERLMDDADLRLRLSENGRKRVMENYNLQVNTEQLAGVFRKWLGPQ